MTLYLRTFFDRHLLVHQLHQVPQAHAAPLPSTALAATLLPCTALHCPAPPWLPLQAGLSIGVGNASLASGLQSTSKSWLDHVAREHVRERANAKEWVHR